jgi:hypothetical protein
MRRYILGVDPGKITGLFFLDRSSQQILFYELEFRDACRRIRSLTTSYAYDLDVVCEKFIINAATAKKTQAPWSLEMTGVARYFSWEHCGQDLFGYQAQTAKTFGTMDRLKALGWWVPTKNGHGNDGARQVLLHLVENGWWDDRIGSRFAAKVG